MRTLQVSMVKADHTPPNPQRVWETLRSHRSCLGHANKNTLCEPGQIEHSSSEESCIDGRLIVDPVNAPPDEDRRFC